MSGRGYFADPDPNDFSDGPRLPETYLPHSLEGMLPGAIVHLNPEPAFIHANSLGEVYINPAYSYDPVDANSPDYMGDYYVAAMRVYRQAKDGTLLDGFIVDIRTVPAMQILVMSPEDDMDEATNKYLASRSKAIGVIRHTEDGEPEYGSAFRDDTIEAAEQLAKVVDRLSLGIEATTDEIPEKAPDEPPAPKRPKVHDKGKKGQKDTRPQVATEGESEES